MKRIIYAFIALALFSAGAQAQEKKHEVYGGLGMWGTNAIIDTFSDIIVTGISGGAISMGNDTYTGDFHVGYKYLPSPKTAFGATFAYATNTADGYLNQEKTGKFYSDYYTLGLEFDYRYISRPRLALYSTVGAGATLYNQEYRPEGGEKSKDNKVYFNFQITPIGVKYGEHFGFFAEAGFGYKGILTVGLFGRF